MEQRGSEQPIVNQLSNVNPQSNSCISLIYTPLLPAHQITIISLLHPPPLVLDWSAEEQINVIMPKGNEAVVWDF